MRTMSRRPFKSLKPPPPACFPCWAAASIALCSCWQCQVWGLACSTTLQSFYVGTMSYLGGDPIQPLFLWVKKSETIGSTLRFKENLIWYYKGITDPEPTEGTDGQVDCRSKVASVKKTCRPNQHPDGCAWLPELARPVHLLLLIGKTSAPNSS